jgi:alkylation response protein AidB-like acyl-CoA dehydrogenase
MIDFTFTEEQDMFRKAAREFAETQVAPRVAEMEETGEVSDAVVKAMAEAEMMALTIPGTRLYGPSDCPGGGQPDFSGRGHDDAGFCPGYRTDT